MAESQVTIRFNVATAGAARGEETTVERTEYVEALLEHGIVVAIDPVTREVIAVGVDPAVPVTMDGEAVGEPAAAEGSQTGGSADLIAAAAGRPMTDAEVIAAGGLPDAPDDVDDQWPASP